MKVLGSAASFRFSLHVILAVQMASPMKGGFPMNRVVLTAGAFLMVASSAAFADDPTERQLPFVANFDAEQYLGKWYEVARLPTAMQPPGTLATAEYSLGEEEGDVIFKNTAYDSEGKRLTEIQGKARLVKGDPPGRLVVSFGPVTPDTPNYYVLHVDEKYEYAIAGVPDRKSLWILAREVPVPEKQLKELMSIASKAGFDVSKAVVAPWGSIKNSSR